MLERLTEKAQKALLLAEEEARRFGYNFVGTEHILLGLIGEQTNIAARVLASFGLYLQNVRAAVKDIIGYGSDFVSKQIPFTPRVRRALALAAEEASELKLIYIGAEHILLGLLREGDGVAVRVMSNLGAEPDVVRAAVMQVINDRLAPTVAEPYIPEPDSDEDMWPMSREEALFGLYGLYGFIKADSVPQEMLDWLEDKSGVLGMYLNAQDDYLIICEEGLHWHDGEARTYIEFKSIQSVELPKDDNDPYLKLILRPNNSVVMLPVLHHTEDYPDFVHMYEYIVCCIRPQVLNTRGAKTDIAKMDIQNIESREDFVFFLRQSNASTGAFSELATWLERGGPKPSWLDALKIDPEVLQNPSVWRLLALILLKFPECQLTE